MGRTGIGWRPATRTWAITLAIVGVAKDPQFWRASLRCRLHGDFKQDDVRMEPSPPGGGLGWFVALTTYCRFIASWCLLPMSSANHYTAEMEDFILRLFFAIGKPAHRCTLQILSVTIRVAICFPSHSPRRSSHLPVRVPFFFRFRRFGCRFCRF
jgi:hypothetical protein